VLYYRPTGTSPVAFSSCEAVCVPGKNVQAYPLWWDLHWELSDDTRLQMALVCGSAWRHKS